jgi:hypothetical protein
MEENLNVEIPKDPNTIYNQAKENSNAEIPQKPINVINRDKENSKERWIETRKEYDINPDGQLLLKKVTKELDDFKRKDIIDFVLRILPLTAIFIPIIIFLLQQKREFERQKHLFELETYINTTTTIQLILNEEANKKEVLLAKDELFNKLYPKIKFINDKEIVNDVDTIKTMITYYFGISKLLDDFYLLDKAINSEKPNNSKIYHLTLNIFSEYLGREPDFNKKISNLVDSSSDEIQYSMKLSYDSVLYPALIAHSVQVGQGSDYSKYPEVNSIPDLHLESLRMANRNLKRNMVDKSLHLDSLMINRLNFDR